MSGVGHKPDYLATDVAIAAMEKIAGRPRDLQALARQAERRLAGAPVRTAGVAPPSTACSEQ